MRPLANKVAIVTGASRGAGRAIALELGRAGATVFCTGRSTRAMGRDSEDRKGTIEDTAEEVTKSGGHGIEIQCDHTQDNQVKTLFAQVAEHQKPNGGQPWHILVNNASSHNESPDLLSDANFWELDAVKNWDTMVHGGVRNHVLSSIHAVRTMMHWKESLGSDKLPDGKALIVNTSFALKDGQYTGNFFYDLAKSGINRMAYSMAQELYEHGIAVLTLSPGFMRTELVLQSLGIEYPDTEDKWKEVEMLRNSESPFYLGRAVVALACDVDNVLQEKSGRTLHVANLAREYGFTDIDGTQPPVFEMPQKYRGPPNTAHH